MLLKRILILTVGCTCIFATVDAGALCKDTLEGQDYTGTISTTWRGVPCKAWSVTSYPNNPRNNCRNPDNYENGPWCYTTDPDTYWDLCDVPLCGEKLLGSTSVLVRRYGELFPEAVVVDRDRSSCHPIGALISTNNFALRFDLDMEANHVSVDVLMDNPLQGPEENMVQVYTNINALYDQNFSGYFEYCEFIRYEKSGMSTTLKLHFFCKCTRSLCQYVFFRFLKGQTDLWICEAHVYPNLISP